MARIAGQGTPVVSLYLPPQYWGYRYVLLGPAFYMGVGDLNSGTHGGEASTLIMVVLFFNAMLFREGSSRL